MSVGWVGAGIAAVGAVGGIMSSNKATDAATASSEAQLEFEQKKYDDWQATYGGLQDNLADYYNSLSADSYTAMGLENSQQAFETSMARINESLAQRGITNSAVGASIEAQAELGEAENRAQIRQDAPRAVQADKMGFLQVGLGQNPGNSMSNALSQQSQSLQRTADLQEQAAGNALGNAVDTGLKVWGDNLASTSLPDYDQGGTNYTPVSTTNPWES